jgi:IS1 family transposase
MHVRTGLVLELTGQKASMRLGKLKRLGRHSANALGSRRQDNLCAQDRQRLGDQWTFVALDPDIKLVPSYRVGKRNRTNAVAFMTDLSERLANRVQLSSNGLRTYGDAVERAFGTEGDYGQAVKICEAEPIGPGRYSPPRVVNQEKTVTVGRLDQTHISTSRVECQNLTLRMSMRRFTGLTNAFSKKVENIQTAVALHFAYNNFVRVHKTLRVTPAMAANVSDRLWSLGIGRTDHQCLTKGEAMLQTSAYFRLPRPGHYILPAGAKSPALYPVRDTKRWLLRFSLPGRRILDLPLSPKTVADLVSVLSQRKST